MEEKKRYETNLKYNSEIGRQMRKSNIRGGQISKLLGYTKVQKCWRRNNKVKTKERVNYSSIRRVQMRGEKKSDMKVEIKPQLIMSLKKE